LFDTVLDFTESY